MESLVKLNHPFRPFHLSINNQVSSFPRPISSVSFQTLRRPSSLPPCTSYKKLLSIKAFSSTSSSPTYTDPKSKIFKALRSLSSSLVKNTCVAVAAAAILFVRFQNNPAMASPAAPPAVESTQESTENASNEEEERAIEEQLRNDPNDVEALRSLMEVKIRARKLGEAIEVIDRLIELEPNEQEWPLLKAHMYIYNDELEMARKGFEEILKKDPYRVEAFHGLVMVVSESNGSMKDLLKRVEGAMQWCKKQKKHSEVRDFKLLAAQVKVMEGELNDALNLYQELVKEEPRDFRPYLCQGIIYTLLRKKDEADKQFEKFRRLVPKNHPYKEYFEENMFATKFMSQKLEREGAVSKS